MLPEALTVLAATGGTAVVQAAGTDAWEGFRRRVAVWFGRGDAEREFGELARLDQTAADLAAEDGVAAERIRIRQEAWWQARFEGLLEGLAQDERDRAVAELQSLLEAARASEAVVGNGALAVGRDLNVSADNGSVAAGVINGGVQLSPPPPPVSSQG
ncbi:hypothetical protein [Streptomyces sp. NRRL S-1022]|uniref:hypothetical protein n=1 Tax=Streptomyces sp. NRRL S-1022 TaxID=1463880 RepID=UPI0004C17406|nr:hypothetical protein [Streptomyces sp. NRRL S-1022]